MTDLHRHLDAETLAKLAGLQLRVRTVVEGTLAGLHRSPHQGGSIEFAEHKEYSPGDDIRHIDWKAVGRIDRYYVRRFEEETALKAYLLLDCSGSMGYGAPLCKLEYAAVLAGALAYLLSRQGDEVALMTFAERVTSYLPPRARSGHLAEVMRVLSSLQAGGKTDLMRATRSLSEVAGGRSLILLISDLFDVGDEALHLLRHLRARRHEVTVFHLLHPDEIALPFDDVTIFEAMEDVRAVLVDPGAIRAGYVAEMRAFLARMQRGCEAGEVGFQALTTAEPLDRVLLRFLGRRSGRS